ncbi:hypothetical protein AHAS_Ahas02G0045000 [Arachis hypogaea]
MHLVSWKTLCQPKHEGGLGFRRLNLMNDAFLLKVIWRWKNNSNPLWTEVLNHKYEKDQGMDDIIQSRNSDSALWREMTKLWTTFQENTIHYLGNGLATKFWTDYWLDKGECLINYNQNSTFDENSLVWEWTDNEGEWDLSKLKQALPSQIIDKIRAIPPPNLEQEQDTMGWMHSPDGDFSVASTYKLLAGWTEPKSSIWDEIWKWKGPQKNKIFMWLTMHQRIPTKERMKKICGGNGCCHHCPDKEENILHVLRDCPKVSRIWTQLIKPEAIGSFFGHQLSDWVEQNLNQELGKENNYSWRDTFMTTCWRVWFWRNQEVHNQNYQRPKEAINEIILQVQQNSEAFKKDEHLTEHERRTEIYVSWKPPPEGWVALNTDGAAKGNPGLASCGGAIRDHRGRWLGGFSRSIGLCSAFNAELWGIHDGLNLAWTMGMRKIIIYSDAAAVIALINNRRELHNHPNPLVRLIAKWKKRNWEIYFSHILREGNRVADRLARIGAEIDPGLVFWDAPPQEVKDFVHEDGRGVMFPHISRR